MSPVTPKISTTAPEEPAAPNNKYVYVPQQTSNPLNTFMVFLLIGAAFIIGTLYSRVQSLETLAKNGGTNVAANAGTNPAAPAAGNNAAAAQQPPAAPGGEFPTVANIDAVTAADHIDGGANAQIILIEYSDTDCPFCQRFHPTMKQLKTEYGDKMAWVYRHFPLPIHPRAEREAEATECVAELGGNKAFWSYLELVLNSNSSTDAQLADMAVQSGVAKAAFETCLTSGRALPKVQAQNTSGQKAGVSGTPGTVAIVNGKQRMIPGAYPYEQVKQLIEEMLKS